MINFRSKITQVVLGYFFLHEDARMYINEISRQFHLDSGNLTRKLEELEGQGLLKSEWKGAQRYFFLNKDFPLYREYKKIIQKTFGLEQSLKQALEAVPGIRQAVIFGSYAADRMDQHSDIDLFVVAEASAVEVQKALSGIEKTTGRDINPVILSPQEYRKKKGIDPLLKSMEKNKKVRLI
jgi:predicted nucleotidyltransferase